MVTERLYYSDSHLIEFEARVVDVTERVSGWTAVVLDRTAFYPTGGGQPSDTGTLDGMRVWDACRAIQFIGALDGFADARVRIESMRTMTDIVGTFVATAQTQRHRPGDRQAGTPW